MTEPMKVLDEQLAYALHMQKLVKESEDAEQERRVMLLLAPQQHIREGEASQLRDRSRSTQQTADDVEQHITDVGFRFGIQLLPHHCSRHAVVILRIERQPLRDELPLVGQLPRSTASHLLSRRSRLECLCRSSG